MTNILAHPGAGGIPDRSRIGPAATTAPESPERGRRNPSPESLKATYQSSPLLSDAPSFKDYPPEILKQAADLFDHACTEYDLAGDGTYEATQAIRDILEGLRDGKYKLLKTATT